MKTTRVLLLVLLVVTGIRSTRGGELDDWDPANAESSGAFPTLDIPVNEHGAPVIQTLRFNQTVVTGTTLRISGFRFRVNRAAAAAAQGVADPTTMDLYWFFVMPADGLEKWYIVPVKGAMSGFENFFPLKVSTFQNGDALLPARKSYVVIQRLAADSLKEGEEYLMWFGCSDKAAVPTSMSLAVGYRQDHRNFRKWLDLTDLSRFLGLVPALEKVNFHSRAF